jgi:two-component system sensor histidine kinase VanS
LAPFTRERSLVRTQPRPLRGVAFARQHVDLSLIAEEATETLLPLAEERGVTVDTSSDATPTIGSHALLLR